MIFPWWNSPRCLLQCSVNEEKAFVEGLTTKVTKATKKIVCPIKLFVFFVCFVVGDEPLARPGTVPYD
jgi:hypothetical protein